MLNQSRLITLIVLALISVLAAGVNYSVRDAAISEIITSAERQAVALARGYETKVWQQHRAQVADLLNSPLGLQEGEEKQKVLEFGVATQRYFHQLPVVRMYLYNASGQWIFDITPNPEQRLETLKTSPQKSVVDQHLKDIQPSSRLVEKPVQAAGQELRLVQTLVPLRAQSNTANDMVVEILSDVTRPLQKLEELQLYAVGGIAGLMLLCVMAIFISTRRAENIIAKQHEANMDLAAAAATAQAENREKSQFLANISHELRTPLNAIIGFSNIIKNEVMPMVENKKYHDYINDINSSGVHLLSLINDILDYSKAEAGKLEMEVAEINATKLVQNSMRLVEPRAEAAQVKLVEALPKEAIIITTDSKKFKQILLNLLSNAVKFTPAGGEVRVSAWRDLADDTVSFEVRDTGIGIAPKDISRAMAPFGQVDSALSRKYEGTGLGLPLTKKFVEIMGGKFTIESKLNVGTTITFTLPRELKSGDGVIVKQVA